MKKIFAAIVIAVLFITPAMADGFSEPVVEAPVLSYSNDWTGFYAGGSFSTLEAKVGGFSDTAFGLFGGYRHDFGRLVVGGELGVTFPSNSNVNEVYTAEVTMGYDAGNWLPYATVGQAWGNSTESLIYGVGVDYRFANNMTIGAKYLKVDTTGVDVDQFSVRLGMNF